MQLIPGANVALPHQQIEIVVKTTLPTHVELDLTAYLLHEATHKVRGDGDMIFYGQPRTSNSSVVLNEVSKKPNLETRFQIATNLLDAQIGKIAICATLDGNENLNCVSPIEVSLYAQGQLFAQSILNTQQKTEKALILGEIYAYKGTWKFRLVDQGFKGGLKPLAEHFGVEISDQPTTPPQTQSPRLEQSSSKLNLSKITLDKQNSSISLKKENHRFGMIGVNLNWNRKPQEQGFLKKLMGQKVDLDIAAMVEFQNGQKDLIQALGNHFGSLNQQPYIKLQGDDRTGAVQDGEWLHINGDHWQEIKRIVIFAFIYEGVPRWSATDAFITIHIPNQPSIEVALTDGTQHAMCSIVELKNVGGAIQAQREVKYFKGHPQLDYHYGFGFDWVAGRK